MAAGFRALDDERIDIPGRRLLRLCDRGDRAPDLAAAAPEPLDDLALRAAERERDDLRSLARGDVELGRPVVVRPARLAGRYAVSLRLALHPVGVGLERHLVDDVARRIEEVEADRPRRQRAERLQLSLCGRRRLVARGQEPDPAGLGHGRGQSRCRGTAGERCADDRRRPQVGQRFFLRPLWRTGCTGLPFRRAARFGASGISICWPAASM